jgi:hypothetical protein
VRGRLDRYRRSSQRVRDPPPSRADRAIICIQERWTGFFVDRQVHAALDELFNAGEPSGHLVALVAKLQGGVGSVCLPS